MTKSKNFTREKLFDFEIFVLKHVSNYSESIPTKKIFSTKIFWLCHFFTILAILAEKRLSPTKKILHGKNFWLRDFRLKIRFKAFWIHSDQFFFHQFFYTLSFFHYFGRKKQSPTRKILHGKKFSILRFICKIPLKHFESIPTQKFFSTKIFLTVIFHYFGHFGWKNQVPRKKNLHEKTFRFYDFCFEIRFKVFLIHSEIPKFFDFVIFSLFWSFRQKKTNSHKKKLHGKKFSVLRFLL